MNYNDQPGGFGTNHNDDNNKNNTGNTWSFDENPQNNFNVPPIDPNMLTPNDSAAWRKGKSARTLGIVGLVLSVVCFCFPIVGLILGVLAIAFALISKSGMDGKLSPEATTGLICGIIATVLSAVLLIYGIVNAVSLYNDPEFWKYYNEIYRQLQ